MASEQIIDVLLKEYEKQIGIQKEAKDRFFRIAFLHNAAIGTATLWILDKHPSVELAKLVASNEYSASLAIMLMMNAIMFSGSCYQIYSFFASALHMGFIRRKMADNLGADLLVSEEDLGRFPHLGIWLARRSESFPVVMWFFGPFSVVIGGICLSFPLVAQAKWGIGLLFVFSDVLSLMALLYAAGLALWYRKVGRLPQNVLLHVGG